MEGCVEPIIQSCQRTTRGCRRACFVVAIKNEILLQDIVRRDDACMCQLQTRHGMCHHINVKMWIEPGRISLQLSEVHSQTLESHKHWGIMFHRIGNAPDLPNKSTPKILKSAPEPPEDPTDATEPKPVCFVDAAHGNNPTKRRSTAGCAVTHCGGATLRQSKNS